MDLERELISRVLMTKSGMRKATDSKITPDFFEDDSASRAWKWCLRYWKEYGAHPTEDAFKHEYPSFRLVRRGVEPIEHVIDQLKERHRRNLLVKALERASTEIATEEPVESPTLSAIEILRAALSTIEIEVTSTRDENLGLTVAERLERYQILEKNKGKILGLPTGYPSLDWASGGFQKEQLITLVGLSKAGKSIILMNMAAEAYAAGAVPLFRSFEMSNQEQATRYDGLIAGINYRKMLYGQLTKDDWKQLAREMRSWSNFGDFILSSDNSGGSTLSALEAKVQQHDPDILFIDGVYMMDDEEGGEKGSSRALTNITRGLKRMAQRHRIPIVCSTQALLWKVGSKKKGLTSEAIGYTSSFVQDSDLVVLFYHEEDRPDVAKVRVSENRMGPRVDFTVHWDFDRMDFSQTDDPQVENAPVRDEDNHDGGF